jgi:allantoicase
MDGWETRRRRDRGHDHCVVKLAGPCTLKRLEIDTRYFTGNFPPYASVEACYSTDAPGTHTTWSELLPYSSLQGNFRNTFDVKATGVVTHLRLNIFPDGGVARFRAYGFVHRDWGAPSSVEAIDLAAALNGGRALACSDQHYGSMANLLLPGRGATMGFDWVLLRLGHPGRIEFVEVDTAHFKGNFPHQVSISGALVRDAADADLTSQCLYWPVLLEPQLLKADDIVRFGKELIDIGSVSHVRVNMHPDGGMSRVRLFGRPDRAP